MAVIQVPVLLAMHDAVHSASIAQALMHAGATVSMIQVRSPEHLLGELTEQGPALLVLELHGDYGVLEQLRARYPHLPIVVLLAKSTAQTEFAVSRLGAQDLWTLPPDGATLSEQVQKVVDRVRKALVAERHAPLSLEISTGTTRKVLQMDAKTSTEVKTPEPPFIIGANPRMAEIRETIEKVAGTDVTVLIRGESGVGKEVVARLLFDRSRRRQKPYVKVNCAAIPHDLLESELFGYEAGAFTGANRDKPGKFELADHGTLFLDEIAEMHPMLQAKLLHVLQDGRFSRLGAKRDVSVDVRIVCATNKLIEQRVKEGLFREDLLYRINVVTIYLPPLRERRDEIPLLTEYLLKKYAVQYGREPQPFSSDVAEQMMEYDWPGNIRELENLCKRFVIVGGETQILRELSERNQAKLIATRVARSLEEISANKVLPRDAIDSSAPSLSLLDIGRRAAWEAERRAITEMLEITHWNRREAARRLQVSYKALLNKVKQMQLEAGDDGELEGDATGKISTQ